MTQRSIFILLITVLLLSACAPVDSKPLVDPVTAVPVDGSPTSGSSENSDIIYEPVTLKFNLAKGVQSLGPIYIAIQKGYFEKYGITIETVTMAKPNDALPLLISGDLDVLSASVDSAMINTMAAEPNIKFVADRGFIQMPADCTYYGLLIRTDLIESGQVSKPEDLKGKNIVTSMTSPSAFLLSKYLATGGLSLSDINMASVPPAAYFDSMESKAVDGVFTTETYITRGVKGGYAKVLVGAESISEMQLSGIVFGKKLLVDQPELGERFLAAYLLGIQDYNRGKVDDNLKIISEATGEDPDFLKEVCWMKFNDEARMSFSTFDDHQNFMLENKLIEKKLMVEQVWDPRFIEAGLKLIGQ